MMVREGLWSNTLTLINIIISGLVAFGFYSPLVVYLDEDVTERPAHLLARFRRDLGACMRDDACHAVRLTAAASKTRMRFKHPIDPVGGPLMGFIAAWVLAAFTLATLHTSPMPKNAFGGRLVYSDADTASFITSPDAAWLRFVERVNPATALGSGSTDKFSAKGFVKIYTDRREKFDKSESLIVKRG